MKVPAYALPHAPASFRFCTQAYDPWLNESTRSCARFRFVSNRKR